MALPSINIILSGSTVLVSGSVSAGANMQVMVPMVRSGSLTGVSLSVPAEAHHVIVTGAAAHVTMTLGSSPSLWEEHWFKDADGSAATRNIIISSSNVAHRIDGVNGAAITTAYGWTRIIYIGSNNWSVFNKLV